jgi:hypothetical protein
LTWVTDVLSYIARRSCPCKNGALCRRRQPRNATGARVVHVAARRASCHRINRLGVPGVLGLSFRGHGGRPRITPTKGQKMLQRRRLHRTKVTRAEIPDPSHNAGDGDDGAVDSCRWVELPAHINDPPGARVIRPALPTCCALRLRRSPETGGGHMSRTDRSRNRKQVSV